MVGYIIISIISIILIRCAYKAGFNDGVWAVANKIMKISKKKDDDTHE